MVASSKTPEVLTRNECPQCAEEQIVRVPLASWNLYVEEIQRLRSALEVIYDDDRNAGMVAARALRRGVWA